ncbi:MAG: pullulanase [Bacteroidetes bacterium]|nr:pullulanase [Bacteroidota bacterium]
MQLFNALLEAPDRIRLNFSEAPDSVSRRDVLLTPYVAIKSIKSEGFDLLLETDELKLCKEYTVLIRGIGMLPVDSIPCLQSLKSDVPLGCRQEQGYLVFRLFAPRATSVRLHLYDRPDQSIGTEYFLVHGKDGVWELALPETLREKYYAYRVEGPHGKEEHFNGQITIADPYAHAIVAANSWRQQAKCVLPAEYPAYDWEDDDFVTIDPADLVIYELHVRDMTAHASSGVDTRYAGSYRALAEAGKRGGFDHIRSLGVNAVELLPCQHFAAIEPPYKRHVAGGLYNHWNPYERNHWGYMTSFFFAPEPRYSEYARTEDGSWNTAAPLHCNEFRDMVKAFHRADIAVIMDVVYNHTSQYDYQPLKYIDRKYYYRRDGHGHFLGESGCGNDLATEMPMTRRLIVDSILHWMREYHIDGFRFDLAAMIDDDTLIAVRDAARAINPDVILIAEPWGGGRYDLHRFSALGMQAWNDVFRNTIKGSDPLHDPGYLFGSRAGSNSPEYGTWLLGSVQQSGGPFLTHAHSVNYLESHDGYTLGDFIRIATGLARPGVPVEDIESHVRLKPEQMRIAKLAAAMLLMARGAVMVHAGQEYARSRIIADRGIPDVKACVVDHNSYEKDDETNWLNYEHAEWNRELMTYYQGLIDLRRHRDTLRHAPIENYNYLAADIQQAGGYHITGVPGEMDLIVLFNGSTGDTAQFSLPSADWVVLVDEDIAGTQGRRHLEQGGVAVPPSACVVLEQRRA